MPSTAKAVSRITARLTSATVSLARTDVDTVVTEHGIAELRDKTLDERAEALIAIADAAHRGALTDAWRDLRR
jgi:acyl-CoA hydrolase